MTKVTIIEESIVGDYLHLQRFNPFSTWNGALWNTVIHGAEMPT